MALLGVLQGVGGGIAPGDCVLTGLCGITDRVLGPHSGVMFLAVGLVAVGGYGWYRLRRR